MSYSRRRLDILSNISQLCIAKSFSGEPGLYAFKPLNDLKPVPGDLIRIESCRPSKWYISWFHKMIHPGLCKCLLESIDDGEMSTWENIGISVFDREWVATYPEWHWTDKQYEFSDKWQRARPRDLFNACPCRPDFHDKDVNLSIRMKWSSNCVDKTFRNWKKVTRPMMQDFYAEWEAMDIKCEFGK